MSTDWRALLEASAHKMRAMETQAQAKIDELGSRGARRQVEIDNAEDELETARIAREIATEYAEATKEAQTLLRDHIHELRMLGEKLSK